MRMRRRTYTFWIILCEAVGLVAGLLSRSGVEAFLSNAVHPNLMPPRKIFPLVWSILYALMGIGMARVKLYGNEKKQNVENLFITQLIVNFFWPLIFFNATAYGAALLWLFLLWLLVLAMLLQFAQQDKAAGRLQLPYLLWLSFAAYLNYTVWQLNM